MEITLREPPWAGVGFQLLLRIGWGSLLGDLEVSSLRGDHNAGTQLMQSCSIPTDSQQVSYLQKLVRGMAHRLRRCKANKYGRCGK